MSIRRVVLSSFVLVAMARATCAVAEDSLDGAVLGPAEPIGKLLVVKASFNDEPEPLPPAPIPSFEPTPFSVPPGTWPGAPSFVAAHDGMLRATGRIAPSEEITLHLSQAILGLTVAGLNEEAGKARSLLNEFQTKHQPRLLLAAKQAELDVLQSEVERLKLRVEKGITSDQIQLSVKFIEADSQVAKELLGNDAAAVFREPVNRLQSPSRLLDRKEFLRLVESKRKDGALRTLAEPTMVVLSGRPARFLSGGSISTPQIAQAGGPTELEFGMSVLATATIIDKDLMRVALTAEFAELKPANSVNEIPGVIKRRVQTTLELKNGQTVVVGGGLTLIDTKNVATIVTMTAEIVEPTNVFADPNAPPVGSIYHPVPVLLQPLK